MLGDPAFEAIDNFVETGTRAVRCFLPLYRDMLGFLTLLAREYGDLVPLRLTPFRAVFVNHPDLIEDVLVTRNRSFVKSLALRRARTLVGNGLIVSEGEFWLRQRRLMQPAFHRERIAVYGQAMVAYAQQHVADWRSGEVKDIQQEMMQLTLQIVGKTLFDADMTKDAREVGAAFATALESMQARISGMWMLLPDSVPTPTMLRLRRAVRRLDALVYGIIGERRASGDDRGDLLSLLLQARDADDGSGMSDRQLRDEVMTLVLAGHETTALPSPGPGTCWPSTPRSRHACTRNWIASCTAAPHR